MADLFIPTYSKTRIWPAEFWQALCWYQANSLPKKCWIALPKLRVVLKSKCEFPGTHMGTCSQQIAETTY